MDSFSLIIRSNWPGIYPEIYNVYGVYSGESDFHIPNRAGTVEKLYFCQNITDINVWSQINTEVCKSRARKRIKTLFGTIQAIFC